MNGRRDIMSKMRGLPGIEPGTASTLKKNHTARLKPHSMILTALL